MPTIDEHKVPAEIQAELKRMLSRTSDDALAAYAEGNPDMFRGFRVRSKKGADAMRKRLARKLDGDGALDEALLCVLADGGLSMEFTSLLSEFVLASVLLDLMAVYGRFPTLAALLVDYRREVRELATRVLKDPGNEPSVTPAAAREHFRSLHPIFLVRMKEWMSDGSAGSAEAPAAAAPAAELDQWKEKVQALEARLQQKDGQDRTDRAVQKRLDKLIRDHQKTGQSLQDAEVRLRREGEYAEKLKGDLRRAQEEKQALDRTLEERVRQAVDRQLASLRDRWLRDAVRVEAAADGLRPETAGTDVLGRAESVLARQRERDRHSGNLHAIRERIRVLDETQARIRRAQADALHPLPDLRAADRDLQAEIVRLREVAGDRDARGQDFVLRMLGRINAARSGDELGEFGRMLQEMGDMDVLDAEGLRELYGVYHSRMSLLYAAFTPTVEKKPFLPDDPVWQLRRAIDENSRLVLVVDGHNVLHLLPEFFASSYDKEGTPGLESRHRLLQAVVSVFGKAPNCKVEVVFDSPTPSQHPHGPNVREVYSGGGEAEHRADRAIVDYLEYCCRSMSAMPRLLVTDDRDLRAAGRELGAKTIPVPQFGAFLSEALR